MASSGDTGCWDVRCRGVRSRHQCVEFGSGFCFACGLALGGGGGACLGGVFGILRVHHGVRLYAGVQGTPQSPLLLSTPSPTSIKQTNDVKLRGPQISSLQKKFHSFLFNDAIYKAGCPDNREQ